MAKILLVEDETNVGATLSERLLQEGYQVEWVKNGAQALREFSNKWDLVLMDVGLPDTSGFDLVAKLRELSPLTAVLFLTAMGNPEDRVKGLELGAEDYVVKPFHLKELLLRIKGILKRVGFLRESEEDKVKIGNALVQFSKFQAFSEGESHRLTHKECALMKLLYEQKGKVVSRDEILNRVWSVDEYPSPRTVDNFILKLRKIVEIDPEDPKCIRSIRGVGYQLENL